MSPSPPVIPTLHGDSVFHVISCRLEVRLCQAAWSRLLSIWLDPWEAPLPMFQLPWAVPASGVW